MWTITDHSTRKLRNLNAPVPKIENIFGTDSDLIEPTIVTDGKVAISDVKLRI